MVVLIALHVRWDFLRRTFNAISKRLIQRTMSAAVTAMVLGITLGTSAPALATPPTVVGAIHGQFSVDANGAANYSIPLDLPAGPHGLTPKLALSYNSQSGPGLAGYGWTLSGLSAITRCGWTIAQNQQPQPITFTDSTNGTTGDNYCLDGQKLRFSSDGTYTYRKEVDDFSLATAKYAGGGGRATTNGPQWFQVQTKDGLTYQYGATADSEIYAVGAGFSYSSCTAVSPVVVRVWALNSIIDRAGNYINFSYANDNNTTCTGDYWISSITYGGNGSTGSTHTITFTYDNLATMWPTPADVKVSYRGGAAVGHTQRLNGINVYYNSGSTPILTYGLQYQFDPATVYSQLTSITECAVGGCYAPTQVGWSSGSSQPGWTATTTSLIPSGLQQYSVPGDFLGNGADQLMYWNSSTSGARWDLLSLSSNGQGLQSQLTTANNYGSTYKPINYYANGATQIIMPWSGYMYLESPISSETTLFNVTGTGQYYFAAADLNGDGYDDIVVAQNCGTTLSAFINGPGGNSWTCTPVITNGPNVAQFANLWPSPASGVRVADFDGDGRTDFLGQTYGSALLAVTSGAFDSSGRPQLNQYGQPITDWASAYPPILLDVNGDGLTDILYVCGQVSTNCTTQYDWMLAVSTGAGFVIHDTGRNAASAGQAMVVDFEGDGHQDIMYPTSGDWYVMSSEYYPGSNGQPGYYGLSSPQDTHLSTAIFPNPASSGFPVQALDLNGDGAFDLLGTAPNGTMNFALHSPSALRVTSITDGLGNNATISYASISGIPNPSVYTPGTAPLPPNAAPFPGPLWVVSSYVASDGANNGDNPGYAVSYGYQGAARDLQGRGFLGFRQILQVDHRINETTTTTYDQTFPYIGRIDEQTVTNANGVKQLDTVNNYLWIRTTGSPHINDAYFPYVKTSTVTSYGSGSHDSLAGQIVKTVQSTNSYNIWGNLVQTTIDTNPGGAGHFEENIISSYTQDNSSNWCLSLPLQVTVAKSYGSANTVQGTLPTPADTSSGGSYGNQARETEYGVDNTHCRVTSKTEDAYSSETGMSVKTTYSYQSPASQGGVPDPWGNVDEVTVTDGTGKTLRDTVYSYAGSASDGSAADGVHPTSITYNNTTSGINLQVQQTWDQTLGVLKTKKDVNNNLTSQWSYDGFGRKILEKEPDGTSTQWSYALCPNGLGGCAQKSSYFVTAQHFDSSNNSGAWSQEKYDSFGRVVETGKLILGGQYTWADKQYNALGLSVASSAPYIAPKASSGTPSYWTTTAYDDQNRPINVTHPADQNTPTGTTSYIWYNQNYAGSATAYAVSQVTSTTNHSDAPSTETTTRIADSQGNTVEVDDAAGSTAYNTDAFGEVISVKDQASNTTNMDYDSLGHKVDQHDPDMGVWSYQYDALGELITQTDANGNATSQLWDQLGRMYQRTESGPNGSANHKWTYDTSVHCAGKLGSETDNNGFTKTYNCDGYGRSSGTDTLISGTYYNVTLGYDSFGRVQTVSYPVTAAPPVATAPTANALVTPASPVFGSTVTLDGSHSTDPTGLPLDYAWTPSASNTAAVTLSDPDAQKPTFVANSTGNFSFSLVVSDANSSSTPASVSVAVAPAVPSAPTLPTGTNGTGSYTVSWGSQGGADSYKLFYSTNGTSYSLLTTLSGANNTSYAVSGMSSGTYYYEVAACGNGVCSANSAAGSINVLIAPGTPGTPSAAPNPATSSNVYNVSWSNSTGTVSYYMVYTSYNSGAYDGGTNVGIPTSTGGTQTWTTSNNVNGTYTYEIQACVTVGGQTSCSAKSNPGTETVSLPVPTVSASANPSTINAGQSSTLSWTWTGNVAATSYMLGSTNEGSTTSVNVSPTVTHTYTVYGCNFHGCGPGAQVTVTVNQGGHAPVTLTAPTANNGSDTTTENTATNGMLSASGSGTLSYAIVTKPAHGNVTLNAANGIFTYTPAKDYIGSDAFTFHASNSAGASNTATESLTISPATASVVPAVQPERLAVIAPITSPIQNLSLTEERQVLLAKRLQQLPESSLQVLAERRAEQAFSAILPPALAAEAAAWNAASRSPDPAAPSYAPPVFIAYGGARIKPATNPPYQFTVQYNYEPGSEELQSVQNAATGFVYWESEAVDAFDHATGESYGNGIVAASGYDAATGSITGVQSGTGSAPALQNLSYIWDGYGNMATRKDVNLGLTEGLQYDGLNRLSTSTVTGGSNNPAPLSVNYDALGNIQTKSDVGSYVYDPAHAHRLTSVAGAAYSHDANGNVLSGGGRTASWTPENQPAQVTYNGNSMSFAYDPDGARYKEYSLPSGSSAGTTTLEIGGYAEIVTPDGGSPTYSLMIQAGGKTLAIHAIQSNGSYTDSYRLYDHLGSLDTVTNANGTLVTNGKTSYDAFGKQRNPTTWAPLSQAPSGTTDPGYTGQQDLNSVGLIHMNGRVYDPAVGRFVSADPTVPNLHRSQDLNRYAYVNNNPLNSTDPTGFAGEGSNPPPVTIPAIGDPSFNITWDLENGFQQGANGSGAGNPSSSLPSGSNPDVVDGQSSTSNTGNNGAWAAFSNGFAPYTVALGEQGEQGTLWDNTKGAAGVLWNTFAQLGDMAINGAIYQGAGQYAAAAISGDLTHIPQVSVANNGLKGAAWMEWALAVGVVGDLSKLNMLNRLSNARRLGNEGEAAVRSVYDIGNSAQININGRTRIPDGLNREDGVLSEVKNVGSLSLTQQLRDFMQFSRMNGLQFDLYVRPNAQLSQPLLDAINNGSINRLEIPFK